MYFTLTVQSNNELDGCTIYNALLIYAPSVHAAWATAIDAQKVDNVNIGVDKNADLHIDGCYMIELTEHQLKHAVRAGMYGGLQTIEVNPSNSWYD